MVSWPLCGPFYLNVLQNVHVDFLFNFVFDFHYSYSTLPTPHTLHWHISLPPPLHPSTGRTCTQIILSLTRTLCYRLHQRRIACSPSPCLVHIDIDNTIDIDIVTTCGHLQLQLQLKTPKLTKQNCVRMDKLVNCQCCHARRAPRSLCHWRRRKSSTSSPQTPRPSLSTPIVSSTWRYVTLATKISFSINPLSFSSLG